MHDQIRRCDISGRTKQTISGQLKQGGGTVKRVGVSLANGSLAAAEPEKPGSGWEERGELEGFIELLCDSADVLIIGHVEP
jgi:hypothetical protein